jgi:hypothetical protein
MTDSYSSGAFYLKSRDLFFWDGVNKFLTPNNDAIHMTSESKTI